MAKNTFQYAELKLLEVFATMAEKAGKAASAACEKAQLTVGKSEADELAGYAEQVTEKLARAEKGVVDLARGDVVALRTGAALYIGELVKSAAKDEALLLDVTDHDARKGEAQTLAIRLNGGDLFVESVTVNGEEQRELEVVR